MHVERYLQLGTAAVTALGALALGAIQGDVTLPGVVILASAVSIGVTDVAGWFRLNRMVASILALGAALLTFQQVMPISGTMSILSIARLLVYLQIILLFQRKDTRIYAQLLVVSVLEVMITAVFTRGATFGLLLLVYLPAALAVLALLFLYREAKRYTSGKDRVMSGIVVERLWPLAAVRSNLAGDGDDGAAHQGRGGELLWRITTMTLSTLVLTAIAFFTLPRLGQPAWRSPLAAPQQTVGYSGSVTLGELGHVVQNREEVARVALTDVDTGQRYRAGESLYLHGTILTRYRDRAWHHPFRGDRTERVEPTRRPIGRQVVRQQITVEPMERPELFHVRPFLIEKENPWLRFDPIRERLLRDEEICYERFTFSLLTTGFNGRTQSELVPALRRPDVGRLLNVPAEDMPSLVALAQQWSDESRIPLTRPLERARYLAGRLHYSKRFSYSLQPQPRDPALDPLEDFVANNPRGHCEYFASALAMMLRSQGFPTRLVVGYCCDEYNDLGQFYQVRQLQAHTWVEAYFAPDQLPEGLRDDPEWVYGAWLRLDATPASEDDQGALTALVSPMGQGLDWLKYVWGSYVMDMDQSRQRRAVYEPLANAAKSAYQSLVDPDWWRRMGRAVLHTLDPRNWNVSAWFSWRGGLVSVGVCLLLVVFYRLVRWTWRAVRGRIVLARRRRRERHRVEVEFYQRLGGILGRRGLVRPPGQTPRQFAHCAGEQLARNVSDPALAPLPVQVVDAFYQVRFGHRPLDNPRSDAVEQALARLEAACAEKS
ncbi:MAG: DUF3488 domain-containing protein [Pirellulales bacterium]|nr:DUF3488 domain-containing protein [Pirellulales bacterium]